MSHETTISTSICVDWTWMRLSGINKTKTKWDTKTQSQVWVLNMLNWSKLLSCQRRKTSEGSTSTRLCRTVSAPYLQHHRARAKCIRAKYINSTLRAPDDPISALHVRMTCDLILCEYCVHIICIVSLSICIRYHGRTSHWPPFELGQGWQYVNIWQESRRSCHLRQHLC
jgi:hypothetical protein